ncbi:hypothetical protein [Robertkochia solimangrovi]|nr:hypothetical protein [Robertkochia solimangrovi]
MYPIGNMMALDIYLNELDDFTLTKIMIDLRQETMYPAIPEARVIRQLMD